MIGKENNKFQVHSEKSLCPNHFFLKKKSKMIFPITFTFHCQKIWFLFILNLLKSYHKKLFVKFLTFTCILLVHKVSYEFFKIMT